MEKNKTGRGPARHYFANTSAGKELRYNVALSYESQGTPTEKSEEIIAGTTVLVLTLGKRVGEGRIAADMKARKA